MMMSSLDPMFYPTDIPMKYLLASKLVLSWFLSAPSTTYPLQNPIVNHPEKTGWWYTYPSEKYEFVS